MNQSKAPTFTIPNTFISSVEHPTAVGQEERLVASLGGKSTIQASLSYGLAAKPLRVNFSRGDPYRTHVAAEELGVSNAALKIVIPKWTGRKRKRGTQDPFERYESDEIYHSCSQDLRRLRNALRDCDKTCRIEAIGNVAETFKFQGLPDFQYSLMSSLSAAKFQQSVLSYNARDLRKFGLDANDAMSSREYDMVPPPVFTNRDFPYLYGYNLPPVSASPNRLNARKNLLMAADIPRNGAKGVTHTVAEVPSSPSESLPAIEELDEPTAKLVRDLHSLLDKRPIITRRALLNVLGRDVLWKLKTAIQYCAYTFLSGPWRDTLIRFGVDPRKDPAMHHGQGMVAPANVANPPDSHIFNGTVVVRDGSTWQVCDITDPLLARIASVPHRETCDTNMWGWYHAVTFAKLQIIMREKIRILMKGEQPQDESFSRILEMPEKLEDLRDNWDPRTLRNSREKRLAGAIRVVADMSRAPVRAGLDLEAGTSVVSSENAHVDGQEAVDVHLSGEGGGKEAQLLIDDERDGDEAETADEETAMEEGRDGLDDVEIGKASVSTNSGDEIMTPDDEGYST